MATARPVLAVAALLLTAGCVAPTVQSPTGTSASPQPTATATPVGTSDLPYDVQVQNLRDEPVTLTVAVVANESGEVLMNETLTLDPNSYEAFALSFPETGNYTVTVRDSEGETYQQVWTVERLPPSWEVVATAQADGTVTFVRSAA